VSFQNPHHADAIQLRHLPVEQRQVRPLLFDHGNGLAAGRRFANDADVVERPEQREQKRFRAGRSSSATMTRSRVLI